MNTTSNDLWLEKSARQDSKQHCNKIAQGLKKFDNKSAARAIWELVQNARDVARINPTTGRKECRIKITLTSDEFIFAHCGKPFCFDSLTSLIKQVSSEEKENDETVGQYGTGFLTTHSFGRRVLIDGSMDINDIDCGKYIDINSFEMDRTFDTLDEFIGKMAEQIKHAFGYAKEPHVDEAREWTRLRYQLSSADRAAEKAKEAIATAAISFPYVMTVNDSIVSVELDDRVNGLHMIFSQKDAPSEAGLNVKEITVANGDVELVKKIYYLMSEDENDMAILPLASANKTCPFSGIAKIFVHFPLLGTEDFGMECIFHSKRFFPVEARDGLHLPIDNANVEKEYRANVEVLKEMSEMVLRYYSEHASEICGMVDVCRLNFPTIGNDDNMTDAFFSEMKKMWSDSFLSYRMVPTEEGMKSVGAGEVKIFDSAITAAINESTENSLSVIYPYTEMVSRMPVKDESIRWSDNVRTWYEDTSCYSVSLEDIASKVSADSNFDNLHALLTFISAAGEATLFRSYALIPNRENELRKVGDLRDAEEIPSMLYDVARKLVPATTTRFVKESFSDICELDKYGRNDLRMAINNSLSEADREYIQRGKPYDTQRIAALIELCSIFPKLPSETLCSKALPLIAQFYGSEISLRELPKLADNEEPFYETPFRKLLETTLLSVSQKGKEWLGENHAWLLSLMGLIGNSDVFANRQRGLRDKYGIFPNRNGSFCLAKDLKVYADSNEALLALAKEGLGKDFKEEIVAEDFAPFNDFDVITSAEIGREMEDALENGELPSKVVLDIINLIDKDREYWSAIFKDIAKNKEKLFFDQKQGKSRDALYKLMKADDETLETLAKLSEQTDMDAIIARALAEIEVRKAEKARFEFNYGLGKHIEDMLRERIGNELSDKVQVRANDDQFGQDIVVTSGETPIYYIEVKAKWNFIDAAHMTKMQMGKAVSNPDKYALCCVDLTDYNAQDEYPEAADAIAHTYVHLDIADKLHGIMSGITKADEGDYEQTISMGGDYRCNIPKKVFTSGTPFNTLIEAISSKL